MYIAFSYGFQLGAFQVFLPLQQQGQGGGVLVTGSNIAHVDEPRKDKYAGQSYEISKFNWEEAQRQKQALKAKTQEVAEKLRAKELQIEVIEKKRLRRLNDEFLQKELLKHLRELKILSDYHQMMLNAYNIFLREEDDILAVLLSLPFVG